MGAAFRSAYRRRPSLFYHFPSNGSLFAWREEKDSITTPVIEAFAQPEHVFSSLQASRLPTHKKTPLS